MVFASEAKDVSGYDVRKALLEEGGEKKIYCTTEWFHFRSTHKHLGNISNANEDKVETLISGITEVLITLLKQLHPIYTKKGE